jgi:hypothetical protein
LAPALLAVTEAPMTSSTFMPMALPALQLELDALSFSLGLIFFALGFSLFFKALASEKNDEDFWVNELMVERELELDLSDPSLRRLGRLPSLLGKPPEEESDTFSPEPTPC